MLEYTFFFFTILLSFTNVDGVAVSFYVFFMFHLTLSHLLALMDAPNGKYSGYLKLNVRL